MRRELVLLAVALPLLTIALGIWRAESHLRSSEVWHFKITGYDPRDLLRGHYLRFRVQLDEGPALQACAPGESCCLCLQRRGATEPPQVRETTCELARPDCDGVLQRDLVQALRRYYIPEDRASEIEALVGAAQAAGDAQVLLSISEDGVPQISDLWVEGRPLAEHLEGRDD